MKPSKELMNDDHAQAGIGTLIIFIAMVLVAAVAAAVLISTSGLLQQKAQQTGTESIAETSSNIMIDTITGGRATATTEALNYYFITVKPAAGAGRIDLNQTRITFSDNSTSVVLSRSATEDSTHFRVEELRDDDNSITGTGNTDNVVMNSGDLVKIVIGGQLVGINAAPRKTISFTLTPEAGNPVRVSLTTPSSYGINKNLTLYPVES